MKEVVSAVRRRNVEVAHPEPANVNEEVLRVRNQEGSLRKAVVPKMEELFSTSKVY